MKYICTCCGQEHENWPALIFKSPAYYNGLTEEEKKDNAELTSDFCLAADGEHIHRFIRCTLTQKVIDHCEDLEYGIWVSLSEKSYKDYSDNFTNENHLVNYFGWFCSRIPEYEDTLSIPTNVQTRSGNKRPDVIPDPDFDHPFVKDYYNGITKEEAEKRINNMLTGPGSV